jgi:acetyl-CoA acyltransferase
MNQAFVYDAVRTPFGKFGSGLAGVRPDDLAAHVIRESVKRAPALDPERIDEVVFGNANGAGEENRNIARMGTLLAGLPVSIPGTTVNRLCGSSLDAAIIASRQINAGDADLVLVGGAESMSRAPWVLPKTEKPYPAGDMTLASTTLGWRLVNKAMPKEWTISLGEATERLREKYGVTREAQDQFAADSHNLSAAAWDEGFYDNLVAPVPGTDLVRDEGIRPGSTPEKLAALKTVFRKEPEGAEVGGTVTAGNASPLSDGASAAWVGSESAAGLLGLEPLARIAGRGAHGNDPQYFGFAPVEAANKALAKAGIGWDQVGAVELNEAFAAQSLVH